MSSPKFPVEEVPGEWVEFARRTGQMTQKELGDKLHVDQSVISRIEKSSLVPREYLADLDNIFGGQKWRISGKTSKVAELTAAIPPHLRIDPSLQVVSVPIVGRVAASGIDYAPEEPPRGTTPFPLYGPARGRLEALVVAGDSMEPTAPDGSYIILKSRDFFKSNNLAVVRVDGQVLLKRVVVHGESLTLDCDNKKHRPIRHAAKQVEILATVHQIVIVREP